MNRLVNLVKIEDINNLKRGDIVMGEFPRIGASDEVFLVYDGKGDNVDYFLDKLRDGKIVRWNLFNEKFSKSIKNGIIRGFHLCGINKIYTKEDKDYNKINELMTESGL